MNTFLEDCARAAGNTVPILHSAAQTATAPQNADGIQAVEGCPPRRYVLGVNLRVVNKCSHTELSGRGAFRKTRFALHQLAEHIGDGHPWMPAILDGDGRRKQVNSNYAELLGLDIDAGMTIAQAMAHPSIVAHCGLGIETSSSTPEHNKFRLVFPLAIPIDGWRNIRLANRFLAHLVGSADPACKDASRFFFGAQGREAFLLNESAALPADFLEQAIAWDEAEQAAIAAEKAAKQAARAKAYQGTGAAPMRSTGAADCELSIIESALAAIAPYTPGGGRYPELIPMMAGVLNDLGSAVGRAVLRQWDGGRGGWVNFERTMDSLEQSSPGGRAAGIGSLFHLAQSEGWQRPVGAKAKAKARKPPQNHRPAAVIAESIGHSGGDPVEALKEHYRPRPMAADFIIQSSGNGLTPEAKEVLDANPVAFITGQTGSGKTSTLLDWTAGYILENFSPPTAMVAPTNNLAGGLAVAAAERGIDAALLRDSQGGSRFGGSKAAGLATESLYRFPDAQGYIFDEVSAQLRRILQGNLGEAADQNFGTFNRVLASTKRLSMLDASIPPEVREYIETVRGQKIPVIKVERQFPDKDPVEVTTYVDQWVIPKGDAQPFYASGKAALMENLDATIMPGGMALLLSGGADSANQVKQHYRQQRKANGMRVRVLEVDGDTTPEAVRLEFAANPTAFIAKHNYDLVIITRLAETGADIRNEFDAVFLTLTLGQTASEGYQHLSRARALFQGQCSDLHIYFPGEAGTQPTEEPGIEDGAATLAQSLDWQWQQAQIKKEHQSTLGTLASGVTPGDAPGQKALGYVVASQGRLGLAIGTQAKMQAREAAEKNWRFDYLTGMLRDRGFNVAAEPLTDDGSATKKWLGKGSDKAAPGLLTVHRENNKKTKANCRARGNRLQSEYPEKYQDKIGDPREQGWILRQKRQQLKDSGDFPKSPLDVSWHLDNIENDRLRPQAKCRALLLVPGEGVAILRNRTVAEIMSAKLGFLELHKRIHRHEVHRMALMQIFSASSLLTGILNNLSDGEWSEASPGAAQLATLIRDNQSALEMYCFREYGSPFIWNEKSDIALVNKFWKLILGLQAEQRGQRTVEGKRVRIYGLGDLSDLASEMSASHAVALLSRLGAIESEAGDWDSTSPDVESVQALISACTLKSEREDSKDFSVQAGESPVDAGATPISSVYYLSDDEDFDTFGEEYNPSKPALDTAPPCAGAWVTPDKPKWWQTFEQRLIAATTLEQLLKTKASVASSARRIEVMNEWSTDGRDEWLLAKVARLQADAASATQTTLLALEVAT